MNRRRLLLAGGAIVAAALIFHLVSVLVLRRMAERRAALEAQVASRALQLQAVSARLSAAEKAVADLRRVPDPEPVAKPPPKPPAKPAAARQVAEPWGPGSLAAIARDPKLRQKYVRAYVDERKVAFAGLFARLGLTDDQRRKFDRIEADYQQGQLDIAESAESQGLPLSNSTISGMRNNLTASTDAQIQALFGANANEWAEASRTLNARQMVGEVLQRSYDTAGAISGAQVDQLTRILAANNARYQAGQPTDSATYNWDAILTQASALLSPPQLAAFKAGADVYRSRVARNIADGQAAGVNP